MKDYILNKIKNCYEISDPYKILIIDDIFPEDIYSKINKYVIENIPKNENEYVQHGEAGQRKNISINKENDLYKYLEIFLEKDIINYICDKFDYNHDRNFEFIKENNCPTLNYIKKYYCYRCHTDSGSRVFTLLFYIPINNIESGKDGTNIFAWKQFLENNIISDIDDKIFDDKIVSKQENPLNHKLYNIHNKHYWSNKNNLKYLFTINSKPNRLVIFPTINNYKYYHNYGPFENNNRCSILFPYLLNRDIVNNYRKEETKKLQKKYPNLNLK